MFAGSAARQYTRDELAELASLTVAPVIEVWVEALVSTFKDCFRANKILKTGSSIHVQEMYSICTGDVQPVPQENQSDGSSYDVAGATLDLVSKGVGNLDVFLLCNLFLEQRSITRVKLQRNRISGVAAVDLGKIVEQILTSEYVSGIPLRQMLQRDILHLELPEKVPTQTVPTAKHHFQPSLIIQKLDLE